VIDRRGAAAVLVGLAIALPGGLLRDEPAICPFRRATGLPCPACGLTRSWQAAAHLQPRDSFGYHPLGAVTFLAAAGIALAGRDGADTRRLADRRSVQLTAAAFWLATWLWRLRRPAESPGRRVSEG
jgi:hypothetical protein